MSYVYVVLEWNTECIRPVVQLGGVFTHLEYAVTYKNSLPKYWRAEIKKHVMNSAVILRHEGKKL